MIPRDKYLNQLVKRMNNRKIKIVTGIRRCGKSVLLNEIFYEYLLSQGIADDHIIRLSLEDNNNAKYRNPLRLDEHVRSQITDSLPYYVLLDEIQNVVSIKNPWIDDKDAADYLAGAAVQIRYAMHNKHFVIIDRNCIWNCSFDIFGSVPAESFATRDENRTAAEEIIASIKEIDDDSGK